MYEERVIELIRSTPGLRRQVADNSRLVEDLGFDSLKMVELMAAMEDEFDLIITLDDAVSIRTVADLKATVGAALADHANKEIAREGVHVST